LIPALAAGLCGLVLPAGGAAAAVAGVVPAGVAGLLWFPILILLYDGLGTFPGLMAIAVLLSVLLTSIVPLVAAASGGWRWGLPVLSGILTLVMAVGILASPVYSAASPRRLNFTYHLDGDSGSARFLAQTLPPLPPPVRKAASFGSRPSPAFPWSTQNAFSAPAPLVPLPAPELAVLGETSEGGKRHVRLRLTSRRGAAVLILVIPQAAEPESIRVAGREVPAAPAGRHAMQQRGGFQPVVVSAVPPEGVEIDVVLGAPGHEEWTLLDRSPGLPPVGATLVAARPAEAVQSQDGDATVVSRKLRI
ncbi:MAG TPA: hypothetical protein VGR07_01700, partial [Thermoanaerobaculia bacterium]|nr:hypothetical protein [Thermoanaerobaculia bacterium]